MILNLSGIQLFEQSVGYAGCSSQTKIDYLLNKLSPNCGDCGGKKMYICIQECCMRQPAYVCLECDQQHRLHRKNELRMLFLDHKFLKPNSLLTKEIIKDLSEFISGEKKRSEDLIEKQILMVSLYTRALEELERKLPTYQEQWLQRAYQIVKDNVHHAQITKAIREGFQEAMGNINLHCQNSIGNLQELDILKKGLQEYQTNPLGNIGSEKVYQKIEKLQKNIPQSVQQFVLRTNLEEFIQFNYENLSSIVTNGINRSKHISDRNITPKQTEANRIVLQSDWQQNYACQLGDQVTQLHTMISLQTLPRKLQYLTYLAWSYNQPQTINSMKAFPETLKKLKIDQNDDRNKKIPYELDHLRELKYLTVFDNSLRNHQQKKILQLAIERKFYMLCFLTTPRREGYEKVVNRRAKIQTTWTHQYECLERHYLIFKRKQLQICLLARKKFLRKSYWAEEVINFANCELQKKIEDEFC